MSCISGSRSSGFGSALVLAISQSKLRANPCCCMAPGPNWGKQWGMPPEIGFDLSKTASGRT